MNIRYIMLFCCLFNLTSLSSATPTKDALHHAILSDDAASVEKAFQNAVRNGSDSPAFNILMKAIVNDSTEEIKTAIKPVLLEGKNNNAPILWAALLKKSNAVKALLECGATANTEILMYSVKAADFKTALVLVRSGINISEVIYECMQEAYIHADRAPELALEFMEELIARGYEVNEIWKIFSRLAFGKLNHKVLKLFIQKGANPNCDLGQTYTHGSTPLMIAIDCSIEAQSVKIITIKILLDAGAQVNQKSYVNRAKDGITPLLYAMMQGGTEIAEFLILNGANPDQKIIGRGHGETPLIVAIRHGDVNIVKALLNVKVNVNQKACAPAYGDITPQTPLAFAMKLGRADIVELLLLNGATL